MNCPRCGCSLTVELFEHLDSSVKMNGDGIDITRPLSEWILTGTGLEKMIIEMEKAQKYREYLE
jgi:hypothetical protein